MKNTKKPNILILYSDQHSARALGCYGNKQVITPNLDQLARDGVKLNHAYTQNPICTPSRMCLLSGQYVHNFGSYGLMGDAPMNLPTIFEHCKKEGYTIGLAGKTHTPSGWLTDSCDCIKDGYGFEKGRTLWNLGFDTNHHELVGDDYSKYLEELGLLVGRDDEILQEWFEECGLQKGQCLDARMSNIPKEHSPEAWAAKCTNEFIDQAVESDTPFCFWMSVQRPHQTYAASKEFWDMYEGVELELPSNADNDMRLRSVAAKATQKNFQESEDWTIFEPGNFEEARKRVLRGYYACVTQMDDAVGRVLHKLDELGIREDTIIVYTTDHGEFAGEHGMIEKAPGIGFGCVTKIPMIFSWKNHLPKDVERQSIVESIDIFPTMCSLAGITKPNWVDGIAVDQTLIDDVSLHEFAVTENVTTKTIHTAKYKLTQYLPEFQGGDFGELYDMEADPFELDNLYFKEEYKLIRRKLRYQLYCWMIRTTRVTTVNSMCPVWDENKNAIIGVPWELSRDYKISGDDGKVGREFYQELCDKGMRNYL